jgi:bifunctional non-homologous end joining protein LigD
MLPRVQPINPSRIAAAFDHEDFVFELKHDGFRVVAYIEDGACRLISRKQIQYKSFAGLHSALAKLPVKNAILDGEIVVLDEFGRSQFRELMHKRRQDAAFYAFDLLWQDSEDLRQLPLFERKRKLQRLLKGHAGLLYAAHIERHGVKLFEAIRQKDCEGIVAKHRLAPYSIKLQSWFKVLNPDYTKAWSQRNSRQIPRAQGIGTEANATCLKNRL